MINEEVRHIVEAELQPSEKLLWAGKPVRRPYPWRGVYRAGFWGAWMLFVSIFICGVVFGNSAQSTGEPHLIFKVIFAGVGTAMFAIGFAMRRSYLKAFLGPKYEVYGLTDRRAIILSPLWKERQFVNWRGQDHSKNFIEGEALIPLKFVPSANAEVGTIIFSGWWDKIRYKWYIHPNPESPKILSNLNGFRNIENGAMVARLIKETFAAPEIVAGVEHANDEGQVDAIQQLRTKQILLWSAFPIIWLVVTFLIGLSNWLFFSFITFPFFIASSFYAVREIIRPSHSFETSS